MEDNSPPLRSRRRRLAWLGATTAVLVAVWVVQGLFFTVCTVAGASMEPTFVEGDRLLIRRGIGGVQRGDVLVFRHPLASKELLVKRVVGLPGETIHGRGQALFVDDAQLAETYAKPGTGVGELVPTRVPPGHYYLVGDNRVESIDSRQFDAVGGELVIGEVAGRLWPWR